MPIKNYTTKIGVVQSMGEIQEALARGGATKIMVDYVDSTPVALTFELQVPRGTWAFRLQANAAGVARVFETQKVKGDKEQVLRTSWRNIRDWVMAQMSIIEAGNAQIEEVFLPYLTDGRQTLYEAYQRGQLALPGKE